MSVIAFDGKTVSADKQSTSSGLRTTVNKLIQLVSGEVVGFTGTIDKGLSLVDWYVSGGDKSKFPEFQKTDDWVRLVVFNRHERFYYESTPERITILDEKIAFGCGRDFALGAMEMGADSRRAVEVACKHSVDCGMGITTFSVIE